MQLIRFIKITLLENSLKTSNIIDWFLDHMGMDNKIRCVPSTTIVKLICSELKIPSEHNARTLLRVLVKLDVIRAETSQIYVFNPYIANRLPIIPPHAFGFSEKKIKSIEAKGYRVWKAADDRQKEKLPSSRIRLQAATYRQMKIPTDIMEINLDAEPAKYGYMNESREENGENQMVIIALKEEVQELRTQLDQHILKLDEQNTRVIDILEALMKKVSKPEEAQQEIERHLKLIKGGIEE